MTHDAQRVPGQIDHLWIRVADLEAARDEHRAACESAGFALSHDAADRVQFRDAGASFSLVVGEPTSHLTLAVGGATLSF